ncbi:oligosaccharide flippase family protein [Paenibacillus sp. MMS18-CY102]|uniref:oligosaccharide flippase family protein n=1 Tax=Paenibacillus sp. MMS18-CY102 TaxID=2682849 RepID=UPI001365B7A1|nr:oligosaccharide flippase family protein [Paenibacillus sp. MMS18-CY102]MWC30168.1 oligosaccharide flippase family protein [Paenibacillus sp. MMS18-CY102]
MKTNRDEKGRSRKAWSGALLLAAAMVVSKLIGVLQKIPLQNLAGDRVFGIYNAVYPLYQLLLVAATAGLPPAVAIVVARRLADGDLAGAKHARHAALWLLGASGAAGFALLWLSAPWLAEAIGDEEARGAIRSVAVAFWFVPVLSALRGYAQGMNAMQASAASQVAEQALRVGVMAAMLAWGMSQAWGDAGIAAGAMAGSAAGAAGALLMLAWSQRRGRQPNGLAGQPVVVSGQRDGDEKARIGLLPLLEEMQSLGKLALPMALGAVVVPMVAVVDAFMVPRLLIGSGLSSAEAMAQFGAYGRGQTLVQLVAMVGGAAISAIVPSLALARSQGNWLEAREQAGFALRAAWWLGGAGAAGIALLARPINVMLFADDQATGVFALVGLTALAAAVSAAAAAVLQGCGSLRLPALLLFAGAAAKAVLNAALVPRYGITGAAIAGLAALTAAALAAAWAARAALASASADGGAHGRAAASAAAPDGAAGTGVPPARSGAERAYSAAQPSGSSAGRSPAAATFAAGLRLGFALACMAAALALAERGMRALDGLPPRAAATLQALAGVAVGACAFAAALLRCGGMDARQWRALPGGEAIAARLGKLRLIPRAPQPEELRKPRE